MKENKYNETKEILDYSIFCMHDVIEQLHARRKVFSLVEQYFEAYQ